MNIQIERRLQAAAAAAAAAATEKEGTKKSQFSCLFAKLVSWLRVRRRMGIWILVLGRP